MNWHYLEGSEQRGPVTDADWEALVRGGKVGPDTLVWHEGMAEWLPYGHVQGGSPAAAPLRMAAPASTPTGQVLCAECGRPFPPEEVIRHGNQYICAECKPVFLQKLKEGVEATAPLNYAGFWIRFCAYFIDSILMQIVLLPLSFAIRAIVGAPISPFQQVPGTPGVLLATLINAPISLLLMTAYYTFLVGKYGATLGKMATHLRVVNPDGSPVGYGKACGRYFCYIISSLICLVGFMMAGWDPEKRALHDRICSTRVIRK
jgi:uncharacterized RDD family membrane protein YckC/DNA-directed RNA polymerase subunit RPC12/RpoP